MTSRITESIRVVARIVSKADKTEETRALLLGLLVPTRSESGCVSYELLQNRQNASEFTFVEDWADDASLNAHFTTEHVKAAFQKVPALLAEAPDIRQYRRIA